MKKNRTASKARKEDQEMLPEYRFDYRKARPNRFAGRTKPGCRAIVLDPDVAESFPTTESVNAVLRALLHAETEARDHSDPRPSQPARHGAVAAEETDEIANVLVAADDLAANILRDERSAQLGDPRHHGSVDRHDVREIDIQLFGRRRRSGL